MTSRRRLTEENQSTQGSYVLKLPCRNKERQMFSMDLLVAPRVHRFVVSMCLVAMVAGLVFKQRSVSAQTTVDPPPDECATCDTLSCTLSNGDPDWLGEDFIWNRVVVSPPKSIYRPSSRSSALGGLRSHRWEPSRLCTTTRASEPPLLLGVSSVKPPRSTPLVWTRTPQNTQVSDSTEGSLCVMGLRADQ